MLVCQGKKKINILKTLVFNFLRTLTLLFFNDGPTVANFTLGYET